MDPVVDRPNLLAAIWLKWYPHLLAILAVPLVFLPLWLSYGQHMFAGVLAAVVSLSVLTVLRFWQARGKLSLALTAFVIPAIVALVCVGVLKLVPLAARQSTIDLLRNSDLQFALKVPTVQGEWVHDQTGNMLPLWFAERIGPDCLTTVRRLGAKLGDLQNFDYNQIPTEELTEIRITRETSQPLLQDHLVQWLHSCKRVQLHIDFKHVTRDEIREIERLPANSLYEITLAFDGEIPELSIPGHPWQVTVLGESISVAAAKKLIQDRKLRFSTTLGTKRVSPEVIKTICDGGIRQLICYGTAFDIEDVQALAPQTVSHLGLHEVSLPSANRLRTLSNAIPASASRENAELARENLALIGSEVSFEQLVLLAKILPYKSFATDLLLSPEQLKGFWANTSVDSLDCVTKDSTGTLKRTILERDSESPARVYPLYREARDATTGKTISLPNP